jgi:adenylate cyclase
MFVDVGRRLPIINIMMFPVVAVRQTNRMPIFLSIQETVELGRECDGLLLADAQVSRRHLALDHLDGRVMATDLGSTNGTYLDGQPITATVALVAGSKLTLGSTTLELVASVVSAVSTHSETMPTDPRSTIVAATTDPIADSPPGTLPGSPGRAASPGPQPVSGLAPARDTPRVPAGGPGVDPRRTSIDLVANSVVQTGVDVQRLKNDQGTVTIVFSDIEASTERNMALGDQAWFEVLSEHNAIIRGLLSSNNGTEIKNQGDGFMMSFPGARMALGCMMEVQRQLTEQARRDPERGVRVRVGVHTGEVLVDDEGDLFGKHVVVAARIANLALGGEILVSSLVKEITSARGDMVFGAGRQVELKGIAGSHVVYPVDWSVRLNS